MTDNFYVYVYIDPRNFEDFYYGKGTGSRKYAHLSEESDTEKSRRIAAIKKAGLEPIVRVIARNLSSHDALLVEKTLLWKSGRSLTNVSSGHYAENFRPHDQLHQLISGFDFENGLFRFNVGDGEFRCWEDFVEFGFIAAGQDRRSQRAVESLNPNDVIAAYINKAGYVGIGRIVEQAKPIRNAIIHGQPLLVQNLRCPGIKTNAEDDEKCEYVARVEWLNTVDRSHAKWRSGIFTGRGVCISLDGQEETVQFLSKEFGMDLRALVR